MINLSNSSTIAALVALGIASVTWKLISVRRFYKDLPKPPHSFLWGHLSLWGEIMALFPPQTHYQNYFTEIAKRYDLPDVWYLDLWPLGPSFMVLATPELAMQVSVVKVYHIHRWVEYFLDVLFGPKVIAGVNGATWKHLHHMLAPSFSPTAVKGQVDCIVEHVAVYHNKLRALADTGEQFSMQELTSKVIFDIVSSVVYGFSLLAQQRGSQFLEDFKTIFNLGPAYVETKNPFKKLLLWWKMRASRERSEKLIHQKIKERHAALFGEDKYLQEEKRAKLCVMDRMIVQQIEELGPKARDGLDPQFVKLIVPNLKGLLAGGQGTTSDTLCFIFLLLSLHPEVMSRLRQEHDSFFHSDFDETVRMLKEKPTKTNELEYTTAVIKETLRLFPIGFATREAPPGVTSITTNKDETYPVTNQTIVSSPQMSHYNPQYFPDPDAFLPDRFLESYEPKAHRFAWRPFERGPRQCTGIELAMDQMRIVLLLTVRWFDFEVVIDKESVPRESKVQFTNWETRIGQLAFQIWGLGAGPRFGMPMRVSLTNRG